MNEFSTSSVYTTPSLTLTKTTREKHPTCVPTHTDVTRESVWIRVGVTLIPTRTHSDRQKVLSQSLVNYLCQFTCSGYAEPYRSVDEIGGYTLY